MKGVKELVRSAARVFIGIVNAMVIFGLVISLAWSVVGDSELAKLIGAAVSATAAVAVSGFIVAWFTKRHDLWLSVFFGFVFGGFGFAYILGLKMLVFVLASAAALITGVGGLFFRSAYRQGQHLAGGDII